MKLNFLRTCVTIMLFPLAVFTLKAQEPTYIHYGVSDGLPSALVYCGIQAKNGFMWFGTDKGLVRFDGTRFKVFDIRQGLLDNEVLEVFEDSKQRIWISCFYNNPSYIVNNKVFTHESDSLLAKVTMKGGALLVDEDKEGNIWITRDQDKCCKLSTGNKISYTYSPLSLLNENLPPSKRDSKVTIYQVFELSGKTFLIAGNSILQFDDSGNFKKVFEFELERDLTFNSLKLSGNHLLVSFSNLIMLLSYKGGQFNIDDVYTGKTGGKISLDKKGRFWVSTINEGAICFDFNKDKLSKPTYYLKGQKITNTFEDYEGTMWFCTLNDGIFALPNNAAVKYTIEAGSPFKSNNFLSISKIGNGQIVLGDDTGNLFIRKKNIWEKIIIGADDGYNRVMQILPFPDGTWMAISEEVLYSSRNGKMSAQLGIGAFKSAYLAEKNKIWLGTSHGLLLKEGIQGNPKKILTTRITSIAEDSENYIWAGGLSGLYSSKDNFLTNWGGHFKPLSRRLVSIKPYGANKLMVATSNYGLIEVTVKSGKVESVKVLNDVLTYPIENIQSISIDSKDKIWLSTNSGVYSLDKQLNIQKLSEANGLVSNNVNATLINLDTLWIATISGISRFILKDGDETSHFNTLITGVRYTVNGQKTELDIASNKNTSEEISLPINATMLEVDFAGLYFRSRGNLSFEVQSEEKMLPLYLMTFSNFLNCIAGKTTTTIIHGATQNLGINLIPGRFVITATAILPSGTYSNLPHKISITIKPHYWQTIWAQMLLVGIITLVIIRIFKERSAYLKLQGVTSELQLQAIKSQMNPHFVGNSINAIQQFFYPPDPLKASEYISTFSDLLRRTMDFAEVDFIPFSEEVAYVKDYLEMVKLRFGDRFGYSIDGETDIAPNVKFPAMLLQPILENATIHGLSPDGPSLLTVVFAQHGDIIQCFVTDNGVGIEASLLRKSQMPVRRISKGLKLLDKKVQMLNMLYPPLQLKVKTTDRPRAAGVSATGTEVVVSFSSKFSQQAAERNGRD